MWQKNNGKSKPEILQMESMTENIQYNQEHESGEEADMNSKYECLISKTD